MQSRDQQDVCEQANATPLPPAQGSKIGIAIETLGRLPINGLRIHQSGSTNGWYIWCGGEMSFEPAFFSPMHVEHLEEIIPHVVKYLALPPGFRFLIDDSGYQDIWFDAKLVAEN